MEDAGSEIDSRFRANSIQEIDEKASLCLPI